MLRWVAIGLLVFGVNSFHAAAEQPAAVTSYCCYEGNRDAVERIENVLNGPLNSLGLEFTDQPLVQVVEFLQVEYKIPIMIDKVALDEIGVGADEQVTVEIQGVSFAAGLRLMLRPLDLTYTIRDEALLITTHEEAEAMLTVCVYDVQDLVDAENGKRNLDPLIDVVVSCIATETWSENGGGASDIHPLEPGLLVVSQTYSVHQHIEAFLSTLRRIPREHKPATQSENPIGEKAKFEADPFAP
jgi:hypothetical protein